MAMVRWAPFETGNFDDVVRRTFGDFGTQLLTSRENAWAPALDAFVEEDEMHVRLELPGVDPDADVDIEVTNGVLHITGERKREETPDGAQRLHRKDGEGWYRREMSYGRFERHVSLPDGVDPDALRASYDAGILDITVPLPSKQKRKIKVEVANQKALK